MAPPEVELPIGLSQELLVVPRFLFFSAAVLLCGQPSSVEPGHPPIPPPGENIPTHRLACGHFVIGTMYKILRRTRPADSSSPDSPRILDGNASVPSLLWSYCIPP